MNIISKGLIKGFITILFVLLYHVSFAQFTYTGISTSYSDIIFRGGYSKTRLSSFCSGLDFQWRPYRNISISASFEMPVFQNFDYSTENLKTSPSDANYNGNLGWSYGTNALYKPQKFDYSVRLSHQLTLLTKYYFESVMNSYITAGVKNFNMIEKFVFQRRLVTKGTYDGVNLDHDISGYDIDESYRQTFYSPCIGIGLEPMYENFYISGGIYLNYIKIPVYKFDHKVSFSYDKAKKQEKFVYYTNQTSGKFLMTTISIKAGYYF